MKKASISVTVIIAIIAILLITWLLIQPDTIRSNMESGGLTSVTIEEIHPYDEADDYTYLEATIQGSVSRENGTEGKYAVPIVLIYPDDGGNGVGVVDWLVTIGLQRFGGYFEPFINEVITERYSDQETYVQRVTRAADNLLDAGYILEKDRDAYVKEAQNIELFDAVAK